MHSFWTVTALCFITCKDSILTSWPGFWIFFTDCVLSSVECAPLDDFSVFSCLLLLWLAARILPSFTSSGAAAAAVAGGFFDSGALNSS